MTDDLIVGDPAPAEHFNHPPYRAELFYSVSGWAGVMNRNGVNCLTFRDHPGVTVTTFENAQRIAAKWNETESN